MKDGQDRLPTNEEEYEMIFKAFLTGHFPAHIQTLPEKNWPLTVAGLPVVFTMDEDTISFNYGTEPLKP